MRWASWALVAVLALLAARESVAQTVTLQVTLVKIAESEGGVGRDSCARRANDILGRQLRYSSLVCLDVKTRQVPLNEVWSVPLPTGKHFVVRPIDVDDQGLLVAVDLEESAQGDFRVREHKPLVLGGQSHADGKLVIILETDY